MIWKLLRQHISIPQFAGFFLANLVGMTIILLGIQFYTDTQAVYEGEDSFMKADYLIVNKKVSTLTTITGKSSAFSLPELQSMESQEFVERMGVFTSSAFDVTAAFELDATTSMSTDMFFESVPDDFVDVQTEDWQFVQGSKELPIILPRNYLDLYNFGYAQSRNMPKLSEGILGAISVNIRIRGNGKSDYYTGRIVGFSNRLNTILVPQAFMTWANQYYANSKGVAPTRLILEVNNPTDEHITQYLQDNNYETDQDKLDASKTTFMLRMIVAVVMAIGLVISILALYVLMLSVYLLVEKNNTKLENLLLIGYSPRRVSMPYQMLTVGLNVLVFVIALIIVIIIRNIYLGMLTNFFPQFEAPSMLLTIIIGVGILLIVSAINVVAVYMKVKSIWNRKS
ncbi:MAG: ABC transporter permease [Bacteroidaceae bacterium]|nr:ABC transporter permease [Bacteroidaceae bacterium]